MKTADTSSACVSPCRATWPLQRTAPRPESPPRAAQAHSPPGCATFRSAQQRMGVLHRRAWSSPPTGSSRRSPGREERSCRRTCPKTATCPRSWGTCPTRTGAARRGTAETRLLSRLPAGEHATERHPPRDFFNWHGSPFGPAIGVVTWVIPPVTDRSGIRR